MSRSNPTDNSPNPCTRWYEWDGGNGGVRYYDKESKKNIPVGDFTFILLDEMSTVKGWHDPSDSGIYSNEVRDTKQETLLVKSFKGGVLGEGLYGNIRDRITAIGGKFTTNCYVAYKREDGSLALGSIQFSGAMLNGWVEFKKEAPSTLVNGKSVKDIYTKAVRISGVVMKKKGRVDYAVPEKFTLIPIGEKANADAVALDKQLQTYLTSYLSRIKVDQVETTKVPQADYAAADAAFADVNRSSQTATDRDADRIAQQQANKAAKIDEFDDAELNF